MFRKLRTEKVNKTSLLHIAEFANMFLFDIELVVALMLFDFCLRRNEYLVRINYLKFISGWSKIIGVYALVLLATTSLLFAIRRIPKIGTFLIALLLFLGLAVNLLFYSVTEDFFNPSYLQVVLHSDSDAIAGAIKSYYSPKAFSYLGLSLIIAIAAGFLSRRARPYAHPSVKLIPLVVCLVTAFSFNYALWNYLYFKLRYFPVDPISNSVRTLVVTEKEYREFYGIKRQELSFPARSHFPDHHILLIIDESVRYDYLSNNNKFVSTTPFLKKFEAHPKFYNLGLTLAASTCSFHTKSLILTGTTKLPDDDRHSLKHPTLFQYARRYGYETTILDAPGSNFPNIVIRKSDLLEVDHLFRADELPGESRFFDQRAITVIHELAKKKRGQFIVLIKKGAHFHYESSYPRDMEQFSKHLPRLQAHESYDSSREKMINSYQNALSFTVDEFARNLFKEKLSNLTILWTSDHGQSLQEHGQTYTHCKSDIEQAVVPLLLYSDHPWAESLSPAIGKADGIITSHHNLYPTIISLMSGEKDVENQSYYSLFSKRLKQHELYYLYGGIWTQTRVIDTSPEKLKRFFTY